MKDFPGPIVLIPYECDDDETLRCAAAICALYSDAPNDQEAAIKCYIDGSVKIIFTHAADRNMVQDLIV